ncbi:unnamed protein product [Trypanosoma congolense IL3000]|uniref:WGS project CAEQ00000000 data, annotated contig 414 n=1 Tax=Trypanosoma congolense (strain IL3000) TaxID=1068625 RepID=F9WFP9_TRYCI|nr:unnamed protein product [Trypanosoma congolense IL3000]
MDLEMFDRPGNVCHGHRVILADGLLDRGHCNRRVTQSDAWRAFVEQIAVIASIQPFQPAHALLGGQAVKDGNGRRHIGFQVAEHGVFRGFVTLVILHAERQGLRQGQPYQKDQRQPRDEGTRPMQRRLHAGVPSTCTGSEKTYPSLRTVLM